MNKRQGLKIIVFVLLATAVLLYLSLVFTMPRNNKENGFQSRESFNTFYSLPDNTVDGVYIGSSGVDRYWMPQVAFKETGITVCSLTSGSQPFIFVKYLMEEALKKQDVKMFIVDIRSAVVEPESIGDADIRRVTDTMKFSPTRIMAVNAIMNYLDEGKTKIDTDDLSYYIPFLKYHNRWREVGLEDFIDLYPKGGYMGVAAYIDAYFKVKKITPTVVKNDCSDIGVRNKKVLLDLLDYCDSIDADVIFVSSPKFSKDSEQRKLNYVFKTVKARGYDVLNFNTKKLYDSLSWDFEHDMYNASHANFGGAIKYTRWLNKYLIDKYKLKDHRKESDQSKYDEWNESYENLMARYKEFDEKGYSKVYTK